jgi:hypothetical protein
MASPRSRLVTWSYTHVASMEDGSGVRTRTWTVRRPPLSPPAGVAPYAGPGWPARRAAASRGAATDARPGGRAPRNPHVRWLGWRRLVEVRATFGGWGGARLVEVRATFDGGMERAAAEGARRWGGTRCGWGSRRVRRLGRSAEAGPGFDGWGQGARSGGALVAVSGRRCGPSGRRAHNGRGGNNRALTRAPNPHSPARMGRRRAGFSAVAAPRPWRAARSRYRTWATEHTTGTRTGTRN